MRESEPFHLHILGSDVRYWVYNDEKPRTILMIHGFRGTHHGLHDIIRALPDFRIVVPDLPGFGDSTPMTDQRHDIAGYSAFIRQFVHEMHFTQKPTLLGHSFGSIIAASLAASSPELFDRLILINAIASPALKGPRKIMSYGAKLYYRVGAKLPEKTGRQLLSSKAMVSMTSRVLAKTKDKALRADIHRHHHRYFSSFQTREALLEAFDASIENTAADYAAHINLPTLLIAGAADDIAPLKGQLEIEQLLPDVRLIVVQDVGHLIHREAPKEAAEAISSFVN